MALDADPTAAIARLTAVIQEPTPDQTNQQLKLIMGTVSAVTAGVVTVTYGGGTFQALHLASYSTPTVGDVVAVLLVDSSPIVLGHPVGPPSF